MASVQPNVGWQSTKNTILERNRHMFNNPDMSDINFTCEGSDKAFYAHKYVLGTSSTVFHAMFYGELAVKDSTVHLSDTNEESLKQFLRFLYTEECTLTTDNVLMILYLAKKYILPSLTEKCVHFLARNLNTENVLDILEQAGRFDEEELGYKCWKVIQSKTDEVVSSDNFINISHDTLTKLLKQDILKIKEVELFQAVLKWIDFQCSSKDFKPTNENRRPVIGESIYDFRFFTMSHEEFVQHVCKSNLLTAEKMNLIHEKFAGFDCPGLKWNVAKKRSKKLVRYSRFPKFLKPQQSWNYSGRFSICLCFSVDDEVLLLGVRLFGANYGSKYQVTFEVKESKVQGTYISVLNQDGVPGFDVMLKKPVRLKKDEVVTLSATITGSYLIHGDDGFPIVTLEGVTVAFSDAASSNNGTTTPNRQFHEIILAI